MDTDTLILMSLLLAAFTCYLMIHIVEKRQYFKQCNINEQERLGRAERVKQISKKP